MVRRPLRYVAVETAHYLLSGSWYPMDQAFCECSIGTVSSLVLPNVGLVSLSCNLKERFYVGLQGGL